MKIESLEDLLERFGPLHTWTTYDRFINLWRLLAEMFAIRAMLDCALRGGDPVLKRVARQKFGVSNKKLRDMDRRTPGRGAFTYDWESVTKDRLEQEQARAN